MGWTYETRGTYRTPLKDFIKRRCDDQSWVLEDLNIKVVSKCIAHKYVMKNPGSGSLWKVWETTKYRVMADGSTGGVMSREKWIALDLIQWGGGKTLGWGYKDLEEYSGPNEISCPIKYLEMVPEPDPCHCPGNLRGGVAGCTKCWAREWRARVRARYTLRDRQRKFIKSLKVGDIVVGHGGLIYEITQLKPLMAGYTLLKPRHIDVDATLDKQGIDREAI